MTTAVRAIVPTVVDEPMDFTLVAANPEAMAAAQRQLVLWAARKIRAVEQELEQTEAELKLALDNNWNASGWRRELDKQKGRVAFYRKLEMALAAGYYIVPPFPLDILAIRTKRSACDAIASADVDFPFKLAKVEVRAATGAALKSKVSDRLGAMRRKPRT